MSLSPHTPAVCIVAFSPDLADSVHRAVAYYLCDHATDEERPQLAGLLELLAHLPDPEPVQ